METEFTDRSSLHALARKRGIKDPQNCRVMCGDCQAEPSALLQGIQHWPDCDASPDDILFVRQAPDGSWGPAGTNPARRTLDAAARFFGLLN